MIYMDHAATTPVKPEVLEAMLPYFSRLYGNPSNVYSLSLTSRRALDDARTSVAKAINAKQASEIFFTGCGTESDNLAILGIAKARRDLGNHIITSSIEHHAVLHSCQELEKNGFKVTRVSPDSQGRISVESVAAAITPETTLITIMLANNEIGTLQPIQEIAQLIKGKQILLHTDAVQAIGSIPIDVQALGVDALSMSAHKFYGPKGVGALYLRSGVKPEPVNYGGGQERGLRSGTENVPGIVGLAKALELAVENRAEKAALLAKKRDYLIAKIQELDERAQLTGHPTLRLPGSVSFVFPGAEGESLLIQLDRQGICASSGSACASSAIGISHVLQAIGLAPAAARGSLRLTLGDATTQEELDITAQAVVKAVKKLRSVSPRFLHDRNRSDKNDNSSRRSSR